MKRDPIRTLCDYFGRRNLASRFLDWISDWIVPPLKRPALAGQVWGPGGFSDVSPGDGVSGQVHMAEGPGTGGGASHAT